ncbi:M10 family metallopeptidase [Loktanella sp. S4079]|uniref:M10 family metallopeptidase n=1 Tax=Loktanella sp. S4079 TaxID=579483 RepID=UPI00069620A4|nr:M10 family metallopeptidase [Loktanella sp. S4079]
MPESTSKTLAAEANTITSAAFALGFPSPVDTLDSGTQRTDTDEPITVYFAPYGVSRDGVTSEGWSDYERAQFMSALASISAVADITFIESTDPNADFQVVLDTDELFADYGDTLLGYFYYPFGSSSSVGVFNERGLGWDTDGLKPGGLGYSTIVHEVLHGLGLEHPHDGDSILPGLDPDALDFPFGYYGDFGFNQTVYTAMSYNGGWDGALSGSNDYGDILGPMALDIAALQDLYGANTTHESGDSAYELPDQNTADSDTGWLAIWDTGGVDTIRHSGTTGATIDLRPATLRYEEGGAGFISSVNGISGGYTIANGVVIENAVGGSGNDTLIGNDVDNGLTGNAGNDNLSGRAGDDSLRGDAGNDTLQGNSGDDTLTGGSGNDLLFGNSGGDTISSSTGTNAIFGGSGSDTLTGGDGSDAIRGGSGHDTINGAGGNDTLSGGRGNDSIQSGAGDDEIAGDLGQDTLTGGAGADSFIFHAASDSWAGSYDTITDFTSGSDIIDLSGIDADLSAAGAVSFVENGGNTMIEIDRDVDGIAEMAIFVANATGLTTDDLIL